MKLGLGLSIPGAVAQQRGSAQKAYSRAVFRLDARFNPSTGAPTDLSANALTVQNGSTSGADANDVLFLPAPSTLGVSRYVYLPGANGNYLSAPDEAALDITGDIDIRVHCALDDWTPSAESSLLDKNDGANQRSYGLRVGTDGRLYLYWSTLGTAASELTVASSVATGLTDGSAKWVRATLDVDTGSGRAVQFFLSDDGSTWAQLGTTVTNVATTSVHAGTAVLIVGARGDNTRLWPGRLFRAQVRNGIDGTVVFDWSAEDTLAATKATFTASTGQTVTVNRSASPSLQTTVVTEDNYGWLLGDDDYIQLFDGATWDIAEGAPMTLVVVAERQAVTGATYRRLFDSTDAAGKNGVYIAMNDTAGVISSSIATAATEPTSGIAVPAVGAPFVVTLVSDGSTFLVRCNGSEDLTPATRTAAATTVAGDPRIGAATTTLTTEWSGLIRAVYWWPEELTDAELAAIESDWGAV